jgi:hypothetical protein
MSLVPQGEILRSLPDVIDLKIKKNGNAYSLPFLFAIPLVISTA